MGDKSPKARQRDQRQKNAAKAKDAASLKSKQDSYSRPGQAAGKDRK